jgi:hypothetical protein
MYKGIQCYKMRLLHVDAIGNGLESLGDDDNSTLFIERSITETQSLDRFTTHNSRAEKTKEEQASELESERQRNRETETRSVGAMRMMSEKGNNTKGMCASSATTCGQTKNALHCIALQVVVVAVMSTYN